MGFPEVPFQVTVAADFDGVLHEHKSKWTKPEEIHDGPTPGAVKWVQDMVAAGIAVIIYSTRARSPEGRHAMVHWLSLHGFPGVPISVEKPAAQLYIDDRAFQFNGENWPSVHTVKSFKPWNRKQWDSNRPKRDLQQRISIAIREMELCETLAEDEVDELLDMLKEYGF